ncbi:TetR/AcrR family transcriptional regulator [Nannocystis pusilla]|uniref:TetR/AcrR family transcriptional regulator n=1 Tax=Nannocystis pusilla TaxID=889268 RepID=UPI003DA467DF
MRISTKKVSRRVGRPRAYDPDAAVGRITEVFREVGFARASLDEIAQATGMNRPSLYAAFGDKKAMYFRAIDHFSAEMRARVERALADDDLGRSLAGIFAAALELYRAGGDVPPSCLVLCTAPAEAGHDADIRARLGQTLAEIDRVFVGRLQRARAAGTLRRDADPEQLGLLLAATLHSVALRARAGQPQAQLDALVAGAVALVLGPRA